MFGTLIADYYFQSSENMKFKTHKTLILCVISQGFETGFHIKYVRGVC